MRHHARRPARTAATAATAVVLLGSTSCARPNDDGFGNAPGANGSAGDVLVRYAHLEDPADTDLHPAGSDVPLYVWLSNQSSSPVKLVDVSSEVASSVGITTGGLPLSVPPGELLELGRTGRHLELVDIDQPIAGQTLVPVTLTFDPGGSLTLMVEPVEVLPCEAEGE